MTITARYASRCAACHQPIPVGAQIEWTKGQPARHASCAIPRTGTYRTIDARMAQRRRSGWTGCACGSIDGVPRRSDCAQCRLDA